MLCCPAAEFEPGAVERAQLHLAIAWVSYMTGHAARTKAEAEAVLARPGLPASLYEAAEQRRLLALLSDRDLVGIVEPTAAAAMLAQAALAWRDRNVTKTLELLSGGDEHPRGRSVRGLLPRFGDLRGVRRSRAVRRSSSVCRMRRRPDFPRC
jgi:hypothetical protein